jgi:hypothetical protein
MMRPELNYYALLDVPSTATSDEIKAAYRKRILQVHLDKQNDDSDLCYKTIEAYRVLSDRNLRAKYDIQRDPAYKASEKFMPAGAICYDIGRSQLSKRVLDSISEWKKEFEHSSSSEGFSDNYFPCFSTLMGQVIEEESKSVSADDPSSSSDTSYLCPICDKTFVTETHHWDEVLSPYINMFASDKSGLGTVLMYFEGLLGTEHFNWEPRHLPSRLLGIWGSEDWSQLESIDKVVQEILSKVPDPEEFDRVEEQVEFVREKKFLKRPKLNRKLSKSGSDTSKSDTRSEIDEDEGEESIEEEESEEPEVSVEDDDEAEDDGSEEVEIEDDENSEPEKDYPPLAIDSICFILENQDDQEKVVNHLNDLLIQDNLLEILYIASVMKNYLECTREEWSLLTSDALSNCNPELAMLWTKISIQFDPSPDLEASTQTWFDVGMKIHFDLGDAVLANFCFIYAGYESPDDWEILAAHFTRRKDHFASMEYYLGKIGNPTRLLEVSRSLLKTDPNSAPAYRKVYFSYRVKSLLDKLCDKHKGKANLPSAIEELVELIMELEPSNPLEGFRLVTTTWPQSFEQPYGLGMHRGTIDFLLRGEMTPGSYVSILASYHFLPFSELDEDLLKKECERLCSRKMELSLRQSDFESLTEILLFLNNRCLPVVLEILERLESELQANPLAFSSHKKAMKLLISGSVNKVQKKWMDAMTDYQDALLCSPECMHRVLPCISKLSQDILFHEAVISSVNTEVKDMKEMLDSEHYLQVDQYINSNRSSLVLGDLAPRMDYGYKNSISKIQADPDKMVNQPPPDEPLDASSAPVETNTPMVTLDKNESAIEGQGGDGPDKELNAALAYVDLLKALPLPFQPGPIVMAASHFLRAMDLSKDPADLFAYRNAIMMMAENLLKIDQKTQATIQHCLTHKHMLSILMSANEKLSQGISCPVENDEEAEVIESEKQTQDKDDEEESEISSSSDSEESGDDSISPLKKEKKATNIRRTQSLLTPKPKSQEESSSDSDSSSSEEEDGKAKEKTRKVTINLKRSKSLSTKPNGGVDLIKKSDSMIISKFLRNVINFPKIEPLANIPTLNCSDLMYVETLGNSFLSQFCAEKVRQKHQSNKIQKHLHAYTQLVEVWKGRSTLTDFWSARLSAMEELATIKGWDMEDVEEGIQFPMLNLTDDGWTSEYRTELLFPNPSKAFKAIHGFKLDYDKGELSFILEKDKQNFLSCGNLFDTLDLREIFSNCVEKVGLSLDPPDNGILRSHPFKEAQLIYGDDAPEVNTSRVPNYFKTLVRSAALLCYFSSGLEVCAKSPFFMKKTDEGLLSRLEEHLQHLLRPIKTRREEREEIRSPEMDIPTRFWLNFNEVFEEEEELQNGLVYKVGQVSAQVKVNTFVMTLRGTKATLSPEAEFARDFTRHFDEIGQFFPELLRLKELLKISVIFKKLRSILAEQLLLLEQNGRSKEELARISKTCKAIQEVGIKAGDSNGTGSGSGRESGGSSRSGSANSFVEGGCHWIPSTSCNNFESEVYEVSAGVKMNPQVTYGPVSPPRSCLNVPVRDLFQLRIKRPLFRKR